MNKEQFWEIIGRTKVSTNNTPDLLTAELTRLEISDILRWEQIHNLYYSLAYKNKLYAAANIISQCCYSDDGFNQFRRWLIMQGKEAFLNALRDPDSLADVVECEKYTPKKKIYYTAWKAYNRKLNLNAQDERFIAELYKYSEISEKERAEIESEILYADDIDIVLSNNDDSMFDFLPKLCGKYKYARTEKIIYNDSSNKRRTLYEIVEGAEKIKSFSLYPLYT